MRKNPYLNQSYFFVHFFNLCSVLKIIVILKYCLGGVLMKNYVLITGASGGIGFCFAKVFAEKGYNLILVARSKDKLDSIKKELEANYSVIVNIYSIDLTSSMAVQEVYDYIKKKSLVVDILVNNAGFGEFNAFLDSEWHRQKKLIDLNISALVEMTYLFGQDMKKRKYGKIINLSSIAAFSAGPYMSLYYASKSFVLSFSEALSEELKGTGVSVTALCPGPTSTDFEKNANMDNSAMFSKFKTSNAEDVARAGFNAAMKGKSIKYYGSMTYVFNIITRCFPRRVGRNLAKKMDSGEGKD